MNAWSVGERSLHALSAAILLISGAPVSAEESSHQCRSAERVSMFGEWFQPGITLSASVPSTPAVPTGQAAEKVGSMKLLISAIDHSASAWELVIYDDKYHVAANLSKEDFEGAGARWTGLLPRDISLELLSSPGSDVRIEVTSGVWFPPASSDAHLYSIKRSTPDWTPLYESHYQTAERSGAVIGMLVSGVLQPGAHTYASWCCSGVMVSSNIFLTNWHCGGVEGLRDEDYWAGDICANTVIDMAWDDRSVRQQFSCAEVLLSEKNLDFALMRVRPVIGSGGTVGQPVYSRLRDQQKLENGSPIFLVHHAQCQPKVISSCRLVGTKSTLTYDCDTEPGASGAAVFDSAGEMLGLHHRGFVRDSSCKIVDPTNEAVAIGDIIAAIRSSKPSLSHELGLD